MRNVIFSILLFNSGNLAHTERTMKDKAQNAQPIKNRNIFGENI